MKKIILTLAVLALSVGAFAVEKIYRGSTANDEKILFYFDDGHFYLDAECKKLGCYFNQSQEFIFPKTDLPPDPPKDSICRFAGNRIYNGYSLDKLDCYGTIVVTKSDNDKIVEAKIYQGVGIVRDVVTERPDPKNPNLVVKKSFTVTANGEIVSNINPACKVLYTVKDKKIYMGDSTAEKDCVLLYTGDLDEKTILYIATIATPIKK